MVVVVLIGDLLQHRDRASGDISSMGRSVAWAPGASIYVFPDNRVSVK